MNHLIHVYSCLFGVFHLKKWKRSHFCFSIKNRCCHRCHLCSLASLPAEVSRAGALEEREQPCSFQGQEKKRNVSWSLNLLNVKLEKSHTGISAAPGKFSSASFFISLQRKLDKEGWIQPIITEFQSIIPSGNSSSSLESTQAHTERRELQVFAVLELLRGICKEGLKKRRWVLAAPSPRCGDTLLSLAAGAEGCTELELPNSSNYKAWGFRETEPRVTAQHHHTFSHFCCF